MNGLPTFTRSLRDQIRNSSTMPEFLFLKSELVANRPRNAAQRDGDGLLQASRRNGVHDGELGGADAKAISRDQRRFADSATVQVYAVRAGEIDDPPDALNEFESAMLAADIGVDETQSRVGTSSDDDMGRGELDLFAAGIAAQLERSEEG